MRTYRWMNLGAALALSLACKGVVSVPLLLEPGVDAGLRPVDAGVVDAGFPDAGPGDAGTDAGPLAGRDYGTDPGRFFGLSRCNDAGVQLCDGFETGALDTTLWTVDGHAPTVETTHVARGRYALHFTGPLQGTYTLHETRTFPADHNGYFGRIFLYFLAYPGTDFMTNAHWSVVSANSATGSSPIRVSATLSQPVGASRLNYFGVGTDDRTDPEGTGDWNTTDNDPEGNPRPVPLQEWICLEWHHDGENNETHFWWDAVPHPSLDTTSSRHGGNANPYVLPTFATLHVGYEGYAASDGGVVDVWMDEVAIDSQRIGCVL